MNTPSRTPDSPRAETTGSSQTERAGFLHALLHRAGQVLHALLRRAEEVYFLGGLALVVIGAVSAANSSASTGDHFAGLGLCVAGGLCFVASAIVHGQGKS